MSQENANPFSRKLRIETIGEGKSCTVEASADERNAIARLLDLVALDRLVFDYRLAPSSGHRLRMAGRLSASVVQTCVVSFAALEKNAEADPGASLLEWPEPIKDGTIDLGKVVYETLATALDPFPKKAGASFEWSEGPTAEAGSRESGPFAVLERLKRR